MLHGQYTIPPGLVQGFFSSHASVRIAYVESLQIDASGRCSAGAFIIRENSHDNSRQEKTTSVNRRRQSRASGVANALEMPLSAPQPHSPSALEPPPVRGRQRPANSSTNAPTLRCRANDYQDSWRRFSPAVRLKLRHSWPDIHTRQSLDVGKRPAALEAFEGRILFASESEIAFRSATNLQEPLQEL